MNRETLIERIRAGVLAACDDVSGVILFGSFARGKPARDVDVLVVVRGARKPQRERGAQAIAIRQAVGLVGLDVDVLIYTEEEFRAGLSSRFPLLLDVAFDGQIIYGDGELRSLLQRARQDVVVRGIRRTETGGWRFPVRYRQRTSLSPVDNATWAEKWLADAERDLKAAGNLFAGSLYDRCVTHCQQVTEKSVKAVLACFGCLERSHYVAALLRREIEAHPVPGWESRLARLVDDAEQLEPAATWSRYPRLEGNQIVLPVERYEELEASEALQLAQRSLATAGDFIHWWFQEDDLNEMVETFVELVRRAATDLPADVEAALRAARDREEPRSAAAGALEAILENVALARAHSTPVCQDTGVPIFYVYHPQEISARSLRAQMEAAVAEATRRAYLRPNAVDPLTGRNSGNNLGAGFPTFHFEEWEEDHLRVDLLLKGGGSENVGAQYKLPYVPLKAGRDLEGVRRVVLDAVYQAQGKGCAPAVLGIAIGADRGTGYVHAKEQLFRPLNDTNPVPELAVLEERLLHECNELGIGPMGFGGKTTVFGVKIGAYHRLPACYFVTVAYMCWACRRARVEVRAGEATFE